MVPRPDMHTLSVESNLDEVMRAFATTQRFPNPGLPWHGRPCTRFCHIKDMMWILLDRERRLEENLSPPPFDLRRVLREVLIVPETKPASDCSRNCAPAALAWPWSSTSSAVFSVWSRWKTSSNKWVGEIHDEFDVIERPLTLADGALIFDAALNVRDLDAQYNITVPEDPAYATVGGFVLDQWVSFPKAERASNTGIFVFGRGDGWKARRSSQNSASSKRRRR